MWPLGEDRIMWAKQLLRGACLVLTNWRRLYSEGFGGLSPWLAMGSRRACEATGVETLLKTSSC